MTPKGVPEISPVEARVENKHSTKLGFRQEFLRLAMEVCGPRDIAKRGVNGGAAARPPRQQEGRPADGGRPSRALLSPQCAAATSAPIPVWERTYCGSNAASSLFAVCELSVTENSQQQKKDSGMVKSAGDT
jgi:hypothetical protein